MLLRLAIIVALLWQPLAAAGSLTAQAIQPRPDDASPGAAAMSCCGEGCMCSPDVCPCAAAPMQNEPVRAPERRAPAPTVRASDLFPPAPPTSNPALVAETGAPAPLAFAAAIGESRPGVRPQASLCRWQT